MAKDGKIRLRLRFFSILADEVGCRELGLTVAQGTTGRELLELLGRHYPALHQYSIRLAVNQEYMSEATELADDDEVALITPVSGG